MHEKFDVVMGCGLLLLAFFMLLTMSPLAGFTVAVLRAVGPESVREAYASEDLAFAMFSEACRELGPLDAREDSCRNTKGEGHADCQELVGREKSLREQTMGAVAARESATKGLPFWAPAPSYYWCAERELSGTPHRHF